MSNEKIANALGVRPLDEAIEDSAEDTSVEEENQEAETEQLPVVTSNTDNNSTAVSTNVVNPEDDETYRDIEKARSNIQNIIEQGDDSLKELIDLAKQSESPRAFEVAANLMKTLLDANKDFVDTSMKKKYQKEELLHPKEEEQSQTNVTNNNLILSTNELLKMIKGEEDDKSS